ncbi:MAG: hypothetical protein ABIT36_09195 [Steroidobacteraceae bacterium]
MQSTTVRAQKLPVVDIWMWRLSRSKGPARKYFHRDTRKPTVAETVAFYRERKIGLVMFRV